MLGCAAFVIRGRDRLIDASSLTRPLVMISFRVHFSDVNWTSIIINDYDPIATSTLITIVFVLNDLIDHHLRLHIVIKAALLTLMVFIDLEA